MESLTAVNAVGVSRKNSLLTRCLAATYQSGRIDYRGSVAAARPHERPLPGYSTAFEAATMHRQLASWSCRLQIRAVAERFTFVPMTLSSERWSSPAPVLRIRFARTRYNPAFLLLPAALGVIRSRRLRVGDVGKRHMNEVRHCLACLCGSRTPQSRRTHRCDPQWHPASDAHSAA